MSCAAITAFLVNLTTLLEFLALIVGAIVFVKVYHYLSPCVRLRLIPRWVDDTTILLRIEIENVSKVRVKKKIILLQALEHSHTTTGLSEWVPFSKDDVRNPPGEDPLEWREPTEILKTSEYSYPKEIIVVERMIHLSERDNFLHVGLQFVASSSFPVLKFRWLGDAEQWTSTKIIAPKKSACRVQVDE